VITALTLATDPALLSLLYTQLLQQTLKVKIWAISGPWGQLPHLPIQKKGPTILYIQGASLEFLMHKAGGCYGVLFNENTCYQPLYTQKVYEALLEKPVALFSSWYGFSTDIQTAYYWSSSQPLWKALDPDRVCHKMLQASTGLLLREYDLPQLRGKNRVDEKAFSFGWGIHLPFFYRKGGLPTSLEQVSIQLMEDEEGLLFRYGDHELDLDRAPFFPLPSFILEDKFPFFSAYHVKRCQWGR
jgi:hypothetical protein